MAYDDAIGSHPQVGQHTNLFKGKCAMFRMSRYWRICAYMSRCCCSEQLLRNTCHSVIITCCLYYSCFCIQAACYRACIAVSIHTRFYFCSKQVGYCIFIISVEPMQIIIIHRLVEPCTSNDVHTRFLRNPNQGFRFPSTVDRHHINYRPYPQCCNIIQLFTRFLYTVQFKSRIICNSYPS